MDRESIPKVIRVTATEFEIDDGRVFEHLVELDEVPTTEEFQAIYDQWRANLTNLIAG